MSLKPTETAEPVLFKEERPGWDGYIEWENCPEKKAEAAKVLSKYNFEEPPEFQFQALPTANPVLESTRWNQWYDVLGPTLRKVPKQSWDTVKEEKSKDMLHLLKFPYNGETPRSRLVNSTFTKNEDFFVRNHGGIPDIDKESFYLDIGGLVKNPRRFTLEELQDESVFPRQSNVVTIQCSGTRRIEQIHEYPGDGDEMINAPWGEGAIGTARWTGISLKKAIKACGGLKDGAEHLEFLGAETYVKKGHVFNYAVSVPWRKVKNNEVLLAWEMNGKPLPKIHGFPLRTVVFGYIGARSCKWLYKINAIAEPSSGPVQKAEYLYYDPQMGKHNVTYSSGFSIQNMPVSSAIISPDEKQTILHDGHIKMRGWAYSGGGNWPVRVDVSIDGGSIWYTVPAQNMSEKYYYAWRTWEIDVPVDAEGWLDLCARCFDSSCNTQPTFVRSAWNFDLHVTSSCHRIKVYSVNRTKEATRRRLAELEKRGVPFEPITRPVPFELEDEDDYQREMALRGGRDPKE